MKSSVTLSETQKILGENFPDEGNMEMFLYVVRNAGMVPKIVYQFLEHKSEERKYFFADFKAHLIKSGLSIKLLFCFNMFVSQNTNQYIIDAFKAECIEKLNTFLGGPPIKYNQDFKYKYKDSNGNFRTNMYTPLDFMEELYPFITSPYTVIKKVFIN